MSVIGFLKTGIHHLPQIRLEGERVYLRPPRARDWKAWSQIRGESREFLKPWEPSWPTDALSRRVYARRLRRQVADWRHDDGYSFFVFQQKDNTLLGGASLSNVRRGVAQMASLGYWIGERYARRGFMTEAVVTLINFAFFDLALHRLEAVCLPHNKASRRLLENTGFFQEGIARGYLKIDGSWQDHLSYALLRDDLPTYARRVVMA